MHGPRLRTLICCFALACLNPLVPAAAQTAELPAVLDYVKHPDFRSARLSPDGAHVALIAPRDDTELLMILDTPTMQIKAAFETQKNNGIMNYWWVNEERIVFSTSINAGGADQISLTGDLYAINVDDSEKFILAGPSTGDFGAYQLIDTMENDRDNIMVVRWPIIKRSIARSHPEAFLMDVYKKPPSSNSTVTRINGDRRSDNVNSPLPWGELATDNNAQIRLAWATTEEGTLDVRLREGDQWVDISAGIGAKDASISARLGAPLGFNGSNNGIYHFTLSEHGTIGIALYDIASKQSQLLYAHEKYDVSSGDFIRSADGKDIIGVAIMGRTIEPHYFGDHPDASFHRSLDKNLDGFFVDFQSYTLDQRKGLATVSSPTMAPALFLLDRDKGQFTPLFSSMPKLQGSPMTAAEPISFTARDGTALEGYLTRAAGVEGIAPLIVMPHGGPHGIRDNPVFDPGIKLLASRGYSVLQVNFRGSGGYGVAFEQLGYRRWGSAMVDDVIDGVQHVIAQGLAQADKVCIMGASYGGYSALMAAGRYPDMFKCVVGISGVYDLDLMRKSDVPFLPGGDAYLEQVIGSDEQELAANSPVTLASAIKASVFLAHGGEDRRVRPVNAERLKDALDDAGIDYEWFYVRTAGHGFAQPENRARLFTELLAFLDKNLK